MASFYVMAKSTTFLLHSLYLANNKHLPHYVLVEDDIYSHSILLVLHRCITGKLLFLRTSDIHILSRIDSFLIMLNVDAFIPHSQTNHN
jgi:DNA polymerase IIIc chi subunit